MCVLNVCVCVYIYCVLTMYHNSGIFRTIKIFVQTHIKRAEINSIMGAALNVCLVYENLYVRNILKTNYSRITAVCVCILTVCVYCSSVCNSVLALPSCLIQYNYCFMFRL